MHAHDSSWSYYMSALNRQTKTARRPFQLINRAAGHIRRPLVARQLPESAERLATDADLKALA